MRWGVHWHQPEIQMEPRRAVRIWARTISAIRPPVNVQSVPRFLAASPHANAEYHNQGNTNPTSTVLDYVVSPCKPHEPKYGMPWARQHIFKTLALIPQGGLVWQRAAGLKRALSP